MLGKKRSKEDEGLHNDDSLLEYQNRCLINQNIELKQELGYLKIQIESFKNQSNFLSKSFMEVNCRLLSMVDYISILMSENGVEAEKSSENFVSIGLKLLSSIKGKIGDTGDLTEQHSSIIENIKNNLETIISKLLTGFSFDENKEISESKNQIYFYKKECEVLQKDFSVLKADLIQYESEIKGKNDEITDLKNKLSIANRKAVCNPLIPYIKYSKELFQSIKPEHSCICHVCGEEMINKKIGLGSFNGFTENLGGGSINQINQLNQLNQINQLNSRVVVNTGNIESESLKVILFF